MATSITTNHNRNLGNGQTGNLNHNRRDLISQNVDSRLIENNIIFKSITLAEAYDEAFGNAVDEYNHRQKRKDRRKYDRKGYFKHLFGVEPENESAQVILTSNARGKHEIKSFNEEIYQVGDCQEFGHFVRDKYGNFVDKSGNPVKWDKNERAYLDIYGNKVTDSTNLMPNPEAERAKAILSCFYEGGRFKFSVDSNGKPCLEGIEDDSSGFVDIYIPSFEERNPNFKIVNAVMHNDEWHGTPHIHIDYVPVGSGYSKGPEKQVGFERALADMGYGDKNVAYNAWRQKERGILKNICECFGITTKTIEEEQANNRGKTYSTKMYRDVIREAKADAQEILLEAEGQAEKIIENACKITEQAERDADAIMHRAFENKLEIENDAEMVRKNACEKADVILDLARKNNEELKLENNELSIKNDDLKNEIERNQKQLMIMIGIIANMPKKKKGIKEWLKNRNSEKYEMDKEAYDGFMSTAVEMKRLSGNTLTSDEDKNKAEERLRNIERLEAEKERIIKEQAEQMGRQMVREAVEKFERERNDYTNLLNNLRRNVFNTANRMCEKVSERFNNMSKDERLKMLRTCLHKLKTTQQGLQIGNNTNIFLVKSPNFIVL